jgi:hypothetical protein
MPTTPLRRWTASAVTHHRVDIHRSQPIAAASAVPIAA